MAKPVTIEPRRLARAAGLAVSRLGFMEYEVASESIRGLWYAVKLDRDPPCDCLDEYHRGVGCKHALAAWLAHARDTNDLDDPVLNSFGVMLLRRQRAREDFGVLRNARGEVVTGGAVKLMDVEEHYG